MSLEQDLKAIALDMVQYGSTDNMITGLNRAYAAVTSLNNYENALAEEMHAFERLVADKIAKRDTSSSESLISYWTELRKFSYESAKKVRDAYEYDGHHHVWRFKRDA